MYKQRKKDHGHRLPIPSSLPVKHQSALSLWSHLFPEGPREETHTLRAFRVWLLSLGAMLWAHTPGVPARGALFLFVVD